MKSNECLWCQVETQCPQCIQGKSDAGREADPVLLKHFYVLFIRGGKASGVFNSTTTTAPAAEISGYSLFFNLQRLVNFSFTK